MDIQFFEIEFFEIQFFEKTMKNNKKPKEPWGPARSSPVARCALRKRSVVLGPLRVARCAVVSGHVARCAVVSGRIFFFFWKRTSSSSSRRRSSSSRRRRSYNAGSKRFSQVHQGSKKFNVCESSSRTDGPPQTPLKGSLPLKRFGSASGSTDSLVGYDQGSFGCHWDYRGSFWGQSLRT